MNLSTKEDNAHTKNNTSATPWMQIIEGSRLHHCNNGDYNHLVSNVMKLGFLKDIIENNHITMLILKHSSMLSVFQIFQVQKETIGSLLPKNVSYYFILFSNFKAYIKDCHRESKLGVTYQRFWWSCT